MEVQKQEWETPELVAYDTVVEVTGQSLDKVGSEIDAYTPTIPALDGEVFPD